MEVTPARVRALDGDTLIGEVSPAELNRQIQAWLTRNAHERGAYPRFDPRSGLGLYIYRGGAQFRSAVLDPHVEDR